MTTLPRLLLPLAACATLALAAACNSDETQAADEHTPVRYTVLVDSVETSPPFGLTEGVTVRVQLKFFNALDEDLDDVEAEHFGGLRFTPASLATVTRVAGHNYRFDVTGGTPGAGTVIVSFGHDEQADERSFPPAVVQVQAAPAP